MHDLPARIERIPFGRFHWHLLLMGGLGYTFDGLDAAIVAFVLPILRGQWALSSLQIGFLGSATYIGFFFGAMTAGILGDLIGRRTVMMYALVLYCLASVVSAFASDWSVFLGCRVVAGAGTGAESAIIAPFLTEFVARRHRGRFTGSLAGFFSFGFVGAALLGYFVVPVAPGAWRYVMALTAAPILMLLWWRRSLPESPRWLATVGRAAEADGIVRRMEAEAERAGHVLPPPTPADPARSDVLPARTSALRKLGQLWTPGLRRITIMSWIMWLSITFSYYAFFTWIPSLLVESGMTITKSFGYSLAIYLAQIPGYFSAAWCNEKLGRQSTIATYMVFGGLSAVALVLSHGDGTIMAAGVCLSFFMNGTYAGVYAYTPEIFPTVVRATGMGTASSIGRLGAIASPLLVGWLYPQFGFAGVFGCTTLVLLAGAAAVMIMGVPTRNRSLEQITAEELSDREAEPLAAAS